MRFEAVGRDGQRLLVGAPGRVQVAQLAAYGAEIIGCGETGRVELERPLVMTPSLNWPGQPHQRTGQLKMSVGHAVVDLDGALETRNRLGVETAPAEGITQIDMRRHEPSVARDRLAIVVAGRRELALVFEHIGQAEHEQRMATRSGNRALDPLGGDVEFSLLAG